MSKRTIAIEHLLQWAYGTECVHHEPLTSLGSGGASGLAYVGMSQSEGFHRFGGRAHDDALTLDRFVSRLSRDVAALVRMHGIAGTQPNCKGTARHRFEPVMWIEDYWDGEAWKPNGFYRDTLKAGDPKRPEILVNEMRPARVNDFWTYCPIKQVDVPHEVMRERVFYVQWVVGLEQLRDMLRADPCSLTAHDLSDELPPLEPWTDRRPRIHGLSNRSLTTA